AHGFGAHFAVDVGDPDVARNGLEGDHRAAWHRDGVVHAGRLPAVLSPARVDRPHLDAAPDIADFDTQFVEQAPGRLGVAVADTLDRFHAYLGPAAARDL